MIERTLVEDALRAVLTGHPERERELVRDAIARSRPDHVPDRPTLGVAIGKAALAMAEGAGPLANALAVVAAPGRAPAGWHVLVASHPEPDDRSVAAGEAVVELVARAGPDDVVLVLISGGASALCEQPLTTLAELRATIRALMAAGAPIDELNTVRGALSAIKAGKLAMRCAGRIVTLVASDVIGDPLAVIGSGPTIGPWLASPRVAVDAGAVHERLRLRAREILSARALPVPAILDVAVPSRMVTRDDHAELIVPMASVAEAMQRVLAAGGLRAARIEAPLAGDVAAAAELIATHAASVDTGGALVLWGEATLRIPPHHGEGGRAQQLALELARRLRGGPASALVVGTDGIDGPPPAGRAAPAGAYVDGSTWDAIVRAGIDPARALARCDAGTALAAVGALVITGPTGINHADLVVVG